jgi:hypothetical protein
MSAGRRDQPGGLARGSPPRRENGVTHISDSTGQEIISPAGLPRQLPGCSYLFPAARPPGLPRAGLWLN